MIKLQNQLPMHPHVVTSACMEMPFSRQQHQGFKKQFLKLIMFFIRNVDSNKRKILHMLLLAFLGIHSPRHSLIVTLRFL